MRKIRRIGERLYFDGQRERDSEVTLWIKEIETEKEQKRRASTYH